MANWPRLGARAAEGPGLTIFASPVNGGCYIAAPGESVTGPLDLLRQFADAERGGLWDKIAPLAGTQGGLSNDDVLPLAVAIFGTPLSRARTMFREEAWRQADRFRATNVKLARTLADFAL